ncbi:MAG TPA: ABC-type transport auxiliary lipoprotein family protein [Azonexus sp.]
MRAAVLLLLAALLGGCFTAGKRGGEAGMAIHDLGVPVARLVDSGARRTSIALEVRAPLWMDGLGISYRLTYADASQLREYSRARWAGPPAQLIEQRLRQQLDLAASGQVRGKCVLRVELAEFSQIFTSPQDSAGLLQGRAYWLDPARRPLAERRITISSPAASADARGGVAALQDGVGRLAGELLAWERELFAGGQGAACAD